MTFGAFILYLVLIDKPRFDSSNVVAQYETMEKCQESADKLNIMHAAYLGEGVESRFAWACREFEKKW